MKPGLRVVAAILFLIPAVGFGQQPDSELRPPAQIAVSPSRFELDIGPKPTTETLRLFNFGDRPIEVEVSAASWELDESNQVQHIEPDEQALENWLILNPLRFTVAPGESQAVRFSIRPRVQPNPGEHRAMVYFNEIPSTEDSTEAMMTVSFRLGVAVYAFAPETVRTGDLEEVSVSPTGSQVDVAFAIKSTGNAHVRMHGRMGVWRADAFSARGHLPELDSRGIAPETLPEGLVSLKALPTTPILAGTKRSIHGGFVTPEPGAYVLEVAGDLSGQKISHTEAFEVVAPPTPTPTPPSSPLDDVPAGDEAVPDEDS